VFKVLKSPTSDKLKIPDADEVVTLGKMKAISLLLIVIVLPQLLYLRRKRAISTCTTTANSTTAATRYDKIVNSNSSGRTPNTL
jgi:hypothetical protein